ncbi:MAG: Enoyl-CoA hydratase/carnithine racemase [Stygiobacter sp.]|nr:MAG: Enoyl-CoA hydratase/carnithine racemase [Stygiobacter sp.]
MTYATLVVERADGICTVSPARPDLGHVINGPFLAELTEVVRGCEAVDGPSVLVLTGGDTVFCGGGDFQAVAESDAVLDPAPLYDLWRRLASGPFVSVAVTRGRVNAGGVGLAAACDMVLADHSASFALSELLFGLFPACVLPFLIRRVGEQRAHYLTLSTQPVNAAQALAWGLVDGVEDAVDGLLRKHLLRLRRLDKAAIGRYKLYRHDLSALVDAARQPALEANRVMFSDPATRAVIRRYVTEQKFPWEN